MGSAYKEAKQTQGGVWESIQSVAVCQSAFGKESEGSEGSGGGAGFLFLAASFWWLTTRPDWSTPPGAEGEGVFRSKQTSLISWCWKSR